MIRAPDGGVSVSRVHFKNGYVSRVTRQNPVSCVTKETAQI